MLRRRKIAAELRDRVARRDRFRCSYCQSPQSVGVPMVLDHVIPLAAGGESTFDNLCLCCYRCNEFKGAKHQADDPRTRETTRLYNPCHENWRDHFMWGKDGLMIVGKTACGRATIHLLRLNDDRLVRARQIWKLVGLHPPLDQ
ncbi:MAG TPA: HNH endonuclease signature motif containing protein [Anaerolineae bacterium]|nr:HNH endonuclease signature motif containing protein [Anaerolineae bacterium]